MAQWDIHGLLPHTGTLVPLTVLVLNWIFNRWQIVSASCDFDGKVDKNFSKQEFFRSD